MKNLLTFSLFLLLTVSAFVSASAQKTLTEGTITYELKLEKDNPMASMLQNTNMVLSFKGSLMKTSINLKGGMMSMNIVMDAQAKKGVMLISAPMMGKNMAVEMTPEDIKKSEETQKVNQAKAKIEYDKKSKKKIAGYKCHKAVAKVEGMPEGITLFVTDKIKPTGTSQIQNQIPGLPGFPLGFDRSIHASIHTLLEAKRSVEPTHGHANAYWPATTTSKRGSWSTLLVLSSQVFTICSQFPSAS
jgi:hypothetical protein